MGNVPSSVPVAGQVNQISIPLQCNTLQYFDTYPSVFTATTPLYATGSQQTTFTDLASHITLPSSFAPQAIGNGSDHFTAEVELLYGVYGYSSYKDNPFKREFNQTWDNTTLDIFLPSLSVTTRSGGSDGLYIQNIFIKTYWRRPDGSLLKTVNTNCLANTNEIASISAGTAAPNPAPANGFEAKLPPIASGQKATVADVPISCNDNLKTSLIIGGVVPLKVKPSQQFSLSNFTSYFVLPGDVVKTLAKVDSGIFVTLKRASDGQNGTGDGLVLKTFGLASPQSYEFSRDFVPSETAPNPLNTGAYVPAGSTDPIRFGLPRFGSLSASAVAASGAYKFNLTVSSVHVVISTYSLQTGELTDWRQYSCTTSPNSLFSVPISTAFQ